MPNFVKEAFLQKEGKFLENAFEPVLETHKLHGKYRNYWAFTDVGFINIGTHDIYK